MNNFWVADFETITSETKYYKEHKKTNIVYGYLKNMNSEMDHEFITIKDFLDFLSNQKEKTQICFFHNLGFDATFIIDWLGNHNFKVVDNFEKVENTFFVFRNTRSTIYKLVIQYNKKTLIFRCSKLLLSNSVKDLGKNVDISKFIGNQEENEDFYNVEPEQTLALFKQKNNDYCLYCKRDVEIVKLNLIDFFNTLKEILEKLFEMKNKKSYKNFNVEEEYNRLVNCMTISAISLYLQKLAAPKIEDLYINSYKERELADQFTQGGLTLINHKFKGQLLKGSGFVIDLKSAYPAAMKNKQLSYWLVDQYEGWKEDNYFCGFDYYVEIESENVKPINHKIPLLKNWSRDKSTRYFLYAKNYKTFLRYEEFQYLQKLFKFENVKIIKTYVLLKKSIFHNIIDVLYFYKEHYKKIGLKVKSHTYKILLNAGYGVHGKRVDYPNIIKDFEGLDTSIKKGEKMVDYYKNLDINLNDPNHLAFIPNNKICAVNIKDYNQLERFNNKWLANAITSEVRIQILKAIIHFGPENVIYTDTDSLFLYNVDKQKVLDYCGPNLGDWELEEKEFNMFFIKRAKAYQLYFNEKIIKSGSAGIKKGNIDLTKENKKVNAGLVAKRVSGGLVLEPLWKELKENKICIYSENIEVDQNLSTKNENKYYKYKRRLARGKKC